MNPHYRALALTLGALGVAVGSVGVASLVAWTRCDGDQCSTRLAVSVIGLAPASLLLSIMLLLLRVRAPLGAASRGLTAVSVAVASIPFVAFVLGDPLIIVGSVAMFAVLIFFTLTPEERLPAEIAPESGRPAAESRFRRLSRADGAFRASREQLRPADASTGRRMDDIAARAATLVARTSRLRLNGVHQLGTCTNGGAPATTAQVPASDAARRIAAPSSNGNGHNDKPAPARRADD